MSDLAAYLETIRADFAAIQEAVTALGKLDYRDTTAILGATKKEQLLENLKAMDLMPRLNPEVLGEIENIIQNKPHFDLA